MGFFFASLPVSHFLCYTTKYENLLVEREWDTCGTQKGGLPTLY